MKSLSNRWDEPEVMDSLALSEADLRATLDFLSRTNRWLGGHRVLLSILERWSASWKAGETVSILDVGTGGADAPAAIVRWARRRGFAVRVTAVDSVSDIVRLARENIRAYPEIEARIADFFELAETGGRFDYVIGSLVLHHIPEGRLVDLLQAADRLARRGLLWSDLRRDRAGWCAVKALTALGGNWVVRHDGPLSVRRSFTVRELEELAERAGLGYLRARAHPFFRLSLSGEKV